MRKLNIALIGYGFMGRAHSNAWRQVGSFFDVPYEPVLKVICGRNKSELMKAADKFGWHEHSANWQDVVAREDIDVVDICAPGNLHLPIALAAASAKKIIFCEKPLANTVADARLMLEAARTNGCVHMICHNYRRVPAVTLARELIVAGASARSIITAAPISKTGWLIQTSRESGASKRTKPARVHWATYCHTR